MGRLTLRHVPRIADRYRRVVRGEPQFVARHDRPGLVRPCRLFWGRCLRLRHPDEDVWTAVRPRISGRRARRCSVRADSWVLLRAPDQTLLRDADVGVFADRLGYRL